MDFTRKDSAVHTLQLRDLHDMSTNSIIHCIICAEENRKSEVKAMREAHGEKGNGKLL